MQRFPLKLSAFRQAAAILAVMLSAVLSSAQENDVPRRFRESVSLDTNGALAKKFGTVQDYLAAKQWTRAVDLLADIATQDGDALLPVAPGRYVNVARQCQLILAGLPAEALAVYRKQVDPQAKQWLEAGKKGDDELLERIVRQTFASSFGDEALSLLAEHAWDRGDIGAARRLWEQLIPLENPPEPGKSLPVLRYPDASQPRPELVARLVLCSLMNGDLEQARRELEVFAVKYPDAEGTLAGQTGNLVAILKKVEADAKTWEFPKKDAGALTFAFAPERTRVMPGTVDVGGAEWHVTLPENRIGIPASRPALHDRGPLSYYPVVFGDVVLVNDADHVYAWDLYSKDKGVPAWPDGSDETGVIFSLDEKTFPPSRPIGVPRYTMTLSEDRLFAKMGTPVTGRARTELRDLKSELVCLDLSKQGRLAWKTSSSAAFEGDGWAFEGSPVVDRGRVYVATRKSQPQMQIGVACFDAGAGSLVWHRKVCTAVAPLVEANLITHLLLTLGEDALFLSNDLGVVVAVDPRDGAIRWATSYESREADNDAALSDHQQQGLLPCVFARGTVLAAPNDAPGVMALDASTGAVRWERRLRGGVLHILGVTAEGYAILSGDRLWALDLATGQVRWQLGSDEPGGTSYGQGVLAGDLVYWPRRDELLLVDQRSGQLTRRVSLGEGRGETGGNLTLTDGLLLIAQPNRLVAFGQYAAMKKRTSKEVSASPRNLKLRWRLARQEEATGDFEAAADQARAAAALASGLKGPGDEPLAGFFRERHYRLMRRIGAKSVEAGRDADALRWMREAVELAPAPAQELAARMELARIATKRGEPGLAAGVWQDIIAQPRLSSQTIHGFPAAEFGQTRLPAEGFARHALNRLYEQHGSPRDAEADARFAASWKSAREASGTGEVRRLLRRFPLARDAPAALLERLERCREEEKFADAALLAREFASEPAFRAIRPQLLEHLGACLSALHLNDEANDTFHALAAEFPRHALSSLPGQPPARDYLSVLTKERRDASSDGLSLPWGRLWTTSFPGDAAPLLPENCPSPAWACVLHQDVSLSCVSLSDQSVRWRRAVEHPVRWAAFAGVHLLVGSGAELTALSPETGETRWNLPLSDEDSKTRGTAQRGPLLRPSATQFHASGSLVVVFDPGRRVMAVDAWSGAPKWEFLPSGGGLSPVWSCDERQAVVQSASTGKAIRLVVATGEATDVSPALREAWRSPPVTFSDEGLAAVLINQRVVSFRRPRLPGWTHPGAVSWANADPALLSNGTALLLVIDGNTVTRLNATTGHRTWSQFVARRPVPRAESAFAVDESRLYAAGDGVVRAFSLSDGAIAWEELVGEPQRRWVARRVGSHLVVHPEKIASGGPTAVFVFDPRTGEPRQRLSVEPAPGEAAAIELGTSAGYVVVRAGRRVSIHESMAAVAVKGE